MSTNLPLILPKNEEDKTIKKNISDIDFDSNNKNSFSHRFAQLKQFYIASNIKTIKKSNSQNSYIPMTSNDNNNKNSINDILNEINKEDIQPNEKKLKLEDAIFREDYLTKFRKIKLNLYKNKFSLKKKKLEEKKMVRSDSIVDNNEIDEKYIIDNNNLWGSEISVKNDLNYDVGGDNESDSDDGVELEPERNNEHLYNKKEDNNKKLTIKKKSIYLTDLKKQKNNLEFPLPIKNKRSILYDKNIQSSDNNNFNIKQIKIVSDTEKYKNPFIFKNYSSVNNISHFHKVYRSFNNICRKHYVKAESPSYAFIKSCDKEKIVCNPLGLLKRRGDEGSLDINNQHIGDNYVNCLSKSLKYVKHLNSLEMSNNRLTNLGAEKLFDNIKENSNLVKNLTKLNLSFNNIGEEGIQNLINLIVDKNCQLENLNLEGNNLGDKNVNNLCEIISQSLPNRLNTLNLGKNKITKNAEQGLLSLTDKCSELVVLILRNNQINNLLASKIIINLKNLYSLKILDLSWNLIGDHLIYPFLFEEAVNFHPNEKNLFNNFELDKIKTNMKIIFSKNPLLPKLDKSQMASKSSKNAEKTPIQFQEKKLIKVPQRNPSPFAVEFSSYIKNILCPLIHVNISHNNLPYIDCELISEGAKNNNNILGFHVDGNEMKIDQLGFITPIKKEQKNKNFFSKSQILYEAENFKGIPSVLSSSINKMRSGNNCWVCECWNEVEFSFEVNNKEIKPKYIVVKLHLDFENYSPCDMIYRKKNFKIVRMCPPGKVKYFFTVDGNPVYNCYKEYDYKIKEFEKPIRYTFDENYIEAFNNIKAINSDINDNTNLKINNKYFGENIDIDIQQDIRDSNNKLISKTIHISNYGIRYVSPNDNIITKEYQSTLKFSIPRPENSSSRTQKQNLWNFNDSIWSFYKYNIDGETNDFIDKIFETDFNMGSYDLLFTNDNEFNMAKKLLKDNYKNIINCYLYLSSFSGNTLWQITFDMMTDWLKEKCNNFMADYTTKKMEKIYRDIYYNKKEAEQRSNNKKYFPSNLFNLIRHTFLWFLVEISIDNFMNAKNKIENPYDALKYSMDNFLIKGFQSYEYNSWRKERYYNEEIDNYIKAFIPLIDGVFHTFCKAYPEKKENSEFGLKMTQEDFTYLIMTFIKSDEFNMSEIPYIFHISKKLSLDEISNDEFLYLNFIEFCEALCRVIDIYSPYPLEERKDDWPLEKRKEQLLVEKMENIMPSLFKKINHSKFNIIRDKFISPLKDQITSLYIIDYKNNFYKGYENIIEQKIAGENNDN